MQEFMNQVGEFLKQAWVYIPAIISFISAIGFPSLVSIAKIVASAKVYLAQTSKILAKVNEAVDVANRMVEVIESNLNDEITFCEQLHDSTYSKKEKAVLEERVKTLKKKKEELLLRKVEAIPEEELAPKKVKVKVKIKDPEVNPNEEGAQ